MPAPSGLSLAVAGDVIRLRCSTRADGDFHIDADRTALAHRRQAFAPGRWTQLDEVHGTVVRTVTAPGEHDFTEGDAAVTAIRGAVLAVWVGDCAPVVLVGGGAATGVVHAGWKGAIDGVLAAAVAGIRSLGSDSVTAYLGPCIHACCYEFGAADLARFTERFGGQAGGTTTWGTPSLDMPAVVRAALAEVGVATVDLSACTRCHPEWYYSHRRGEEGRQVMTVTRMAGA